MAYPYQYDEYTQAMLDALEKAFDRYEGFDPNPNVSAASESSMRSFAQCADPWNPLFNDEQYAKNTKWGSIIAFPNYVDCIGTITIQPQIDPRGGWCFNLFPGENWEFYRPVHPGDTFRVFRRRGRYKDVTRPDGSGPHIFNMVYSDCDVINQHGEIVASWQALKSTSVLHQPKEKVQIPYHDHVYTKKELDYLSDVIRGETIRGAVPRYWEDVTVGDILPPATIGVNTTWDFVAFNCGRQEMPGLSTRALRDYLPPMVFNDPDTGAQRTRIEWHFVDEVAAIGGAPRAFNFGAAGMANLARVVTNWMGDDGELRTFKWRHLHVSGAGDAIVGHARVIDKFIAENGEHLVALDVWLDNICRGNVSESAYVTVSLPSRM